MLIVLLLEQLWNTVQQVFCYTALMILAVIVSATLLALLGILQIALALGAPAGRFAWGGRHQVLPRKLRIGSIMSFPVYFGIALSLVSKSGIYPVISQGIFLDVLIWVIFAYFVLGIFMNAISRSNPERYTMTPVATVLAACTLYIAVS